MKKQKMNLIAALMGLVMNASLTVTSPDFGKNGNIPPRFTCDGESISPTLKISGIPDGAKSLALIVDDPDAPNGGFDHWVMWNIPIVEKIEQNTAPGQQGKNGKKENKYVGPCPPNGKHHYHFKVYALDTELNLDSKTDKEALLKAMEGHVMAKAEIVGLYKRKKIIDQK
jgi:Raf kinase inhibitor-like YbhB/YbcL family protein